MALCFIPWSSDSAGGAERLKILERDREAVSVGGSDGVRGRGVRGREVGTSGEGREVGTSGEGRKRAREEE